MHEVVTSPLAAWDNFYVIVGSSAGALTGLQFVVMTLIAGNPATKGRGESIAAFGTPNVVHFCAALLVSAILSIPWDALRPAGFAIIACGVGGVVYSVVVMRRAMRQREYRPVLGDWVWHTALPALAYATVWIAGAAFTSDTPAALFWIGAATLLLVFIGIHNAWDTVTYVTMQGSDASL